jgi:hypothetical protein
MPSASNAACPVLKRTYSTTGCYGLHCCEIASDEEIYGIFDSNPCRRPKRFVKKQQMRWTPRGAHLLLQTRTKVLNGDLEDTFRRWYPAFRSKTEAKAA